MTGKNNELESEFQRKVIRLIESKGGYVVKVHVSAYQEKGTPDVLCCFKGRFIAFELKAKDGRPSTLQRYRVRQIIRAGGIAKITSDLHEIEETLHEISRVQQGGELK